MKHPLGRRTGKKFNRFSVKIDRFTQELISTLPYMESEYDFLRKDILDWYLETIIREGVRVLAAEAKENGGQIAAPIVFERGQKRAAPVCFARELEAT
ncbi:MAG TPA: hypothetical protein VFE31_08865 [Opitutaceae bacterium]|jgi:hypothetical protein|nr:hypothetical protein [Opitutaceae bacterium]